MINALRNTIAEAWDSIWGRVVIIGFAAGWVPFYLLTEAHAALTK